MMKNMKMLRLDIGKIDIGREGIQDSIILTVGIIFRLDVAQCSSKFLAIPNGLEIYGALLFHVTEALTPKALWSYGNSVLTAIPSILILFILAFELRRTRLPTILVETLSICILHKLLELPGDVGLHLRIFIIQRLIRVTALDLQCHAFALTQFTNSC